MKLRTTQPKFREKQWTQINKIKKDAERFNDKVLFRLLSRFQSNNMCMVCVVFCLIDVGWIRF